MLWGFIKKHLPQQQNQIPAPSENNATSSTQQEIESIATPILTPQPPHSQPMTQSQLETPVLPNYDSTHQIPIMTERSNDAWGEIWHARTPSQHFHVMSKNTVTINLHNLDMLAVTQELINLGISVFAAQEVNIHWDPAIQYQMYTQCHWSNTQLQIATSCSQESAPDWYKPGGTFVMALGAWTSRIIQCGSDAMLGRWSYLEFVGKNNKWIIVLSSYHVCNQKFDVASNTISAQQIRLLQLHGITAPNPQTIFLNDLISQIQQWRNDHKEVNICLDANKDVDNLRSDISQIFAQ